MKMNTIAPEGILLRLYKDSDAANIGSDQIIEDTRIQRNTRVCFGNYDRLGFFPVDHFIDFRTLSRTGSVWIGEYKDIMLFSLCDIAQERHFRLSCNPCDLPENSINAPLHMFPWEVKIFVNNKAVNRNFLSISTLSLCGNIQNIGLTYNQLISYFKKAISVIIAEINKSRPEDDSIIFEIYGSLRSAEIAILWGSNEFVEVQYLADQLGYLQLEKNASRYRIFDSSHTIVSLNCPVCNWECIRGGVMLQFSPAKSIKGYASSRSAALEYIQDLFLTHGNDTARFCFIAEENSYICNVEARVLKALLPRDSSDYSFAEDWLNPLNPDFKKHFSSRTIRLCYDATDIQEVAKYMEAFKDFAITPEPSDFSSVQGCVEWTALPQIFQGKHDDVWKQYLQYTQKIKHLVSGETYSTKRFLGMAGSSFLDTLSQLYSDYSQCFNCISDLQKAKDLEFQFSSALKILSESLPGFEQLSNSEATPRLRSALDSYLETGYEMISVLRHAIQNLKETLVDFSKSAESGSPYGLILHAYYGIIKCALLEVAKNSSHLRQTPTLLVPILRFSDNLIPCSKMYLNNTALSCKLVEICIPSDACEEIGLYAPLMIHEIYHYVPPVDRTARNQIFTVILLTELTINVLQRIIVGTLVTPANSFSTDEVCMIIREKLILRLAKVDFYELVPHMDGSSDTWTDYSNDLLFWITGFDESGNENWSFHKFFTPLLDDVYKELLDKHKSLSDVNSTKQLVLALSKIFAPPDSTNTGSSLLYRLRCCDISLFDSIDTALRDMMPDYAMVRYSGLQSLSDYLLLFSIVIDKQSSRAVDSGDQGYLFFRIGFIADYLLYNFEGDMVDLEKKLTEAEQTFCKKYIAYRQLHTADPDENYYDVAYQWFNTIASELLRHRNIHLQYRCLLRNLANNQFAPGMREEKEKVWNALGSPFNTIIDSKSLHFHAELDIIRAFMPQKFLHELQFRNPPTMNTSTDSSSITLQKHIHIRYRNDSFRIQNVVDAVAPFNAAVGVLYEYHRRVFGRQSTPKLWFRGCKSSSYPILPSIMVHFLDRDKTCPNGKNHIGTLVEYQRERLQEFRHWADGANELTNPSLYSTADYIALMQHYSQPTCYLDWTDDANIALSFALEEELKEAHIIQPTDYELEPVLYLFDPKLYNLARLRLLNKYSHLIEWHLSELPPLCETVKKDLKDAEQIENSIQEGSFSNVNVPNVSIPSIAKRYGIHSMNLIYDCNMKNAALRDDSVKTKADLKTATFCTVHTLRIDLWNLPMAIYTSRLNPRIKAQSGNFLAYSVFTRPLCCKEEATKPRSAPEDNPNQIIKTDYFEYISLQEIQKFYLESFPGDGLPFLIKVIIPKGEKRALAQYLYHTGMNRFRIYPELDNLSLI